MNKKIYEKPEIKKVQIKPEEAMLQCNKVRPRVRKDNDKIVGITILNASSK